MVGGMVMRKMRRSGEGLEYERHHDEDKGDVRQNVAVAVEDLVEEL